MGHSPGVSCSRPRRGSFTMLMSGAQKVPPALLTFIITLASLPTTSPMDANRSGSKVEPTPITRGMRCRLEFPRQNERKAIRRPRAEPRPTTEALGCRAGRLLGLHLSPPAQPSRQLSFLKLAPSSVRQCPFLGRRIQAVGSRCSE
jgi:hypothetical protein